MLSDFCHVLWDTKIECDAVNSDGYEISNLISRENLHRSKGFLAASFVKPGSVNILVSFPFPIDVYAVNLNPKVGGQKSKGFQIFSAGLRAKVSKKDNVERVVQEASQNSSKHGNISSDTQHFHSYEFKLNVENAKTEFLGLFEKVLQVHIPEGFVGHFVNPCYPPGSECGSNILQKAGSNVHKCMLQHGHSLRHTTHMLLKINQASVPCIGKLEVFGKPAQNSGKFVMEYAQVIRSRLKQAVGAGFFGGRCFENVGDNQQLYDNSPKHDSTITKKNVEDNMISKVTNEESVPREFLDPITLEIMTLPVLLPSGTSIDQVTLEKHVNTEKTWGRSPSDPFTGLPLGSKVVPNAALKCRIDKFLLSSNITVNHHGRTVGSASDYRSVAKVNLNLVKQRTATTAKAVNRIKKLLNNHDSDNTQPPFKRLKTEGGETDCNPSDSLDMALEEVLRNRPKSYANTVGVSMSALIPKDKPTTGYTKNEPEQPPHGCLHQKVSDTLFQLPCQHVVCRSCLTCAVTNEQCPTCRTTFDRKHVVRVHLQ